jgi:hypothetical protein
LDDLAMKETHMADPAGCPDTGDDTGVGTDRGSSPGTPRWVKVSAAIILVLVLVFVVLKITGLGGEHGPGRHTGGGETPPAGVREAGSAGGPTPPAGGHAP